MICLHTYIYRGYPDGLERTLQKAKEYGYDGVEVWRLHYDSNNLKEELRKMSLLAKKYSLSIPIIDYLTDVLAEDKDKRRENINRMKKDIPLFKDFGIKIVLTSPALLASPVAEKRHYCLASEAYEEIGSVAQDEGIKIVLETHSGSLLDTITSTLRLFEVIDSPAVKLSFDLANLYSTISPKGFPVTLAQKTLEEAIELFRDYIGYIGLKNCKFIGNEYSWNWLLEEGDIDYYKIFLQLKKIDFGGMMTIEHVGGGDPNPRMEKDMRYVKNILKELDMLDNS